MAQQLVNAISLGSIYALFGLGLTLVWGVLGLLNLAHGAVFATGAYLAYRIAETVDVSLLLLLPVVMAATGLVAVALEVLAFRPIRRSASGHQAGLAMLIASIGASAILVTAIENQLGQTAVVSIPRRVFPLDTYSVGGVTFTNLTVLVFVLALGLSVATAIWVRSSHQGRALRAIAYDERTCGLFGIRTERIASLTMFVGGALAGAAGVLLALQFNAVDARIGDSLLLKAFAVIIVGGVGNIYGALAGGFILAFAETGAVEAGQGNLRDAVAFVLVIVLLLIRPEGLVGQGRVERA